MIGNSTFNNKVPFRELAIQDMMNPLDKDELIARAVATGQRLCIREWTVECTDDDNVDCMHDIAQEWAMPDETTKITYKHTTFNVSDYHY